VKILQNSLRKYILIPLLVNKFISYPQGSECDNNSALRETTELPNVQMRRLTTVVNERIIVGSGGKSWPSASPSYVHCMSVEWTPVEEGMAHQADA
jgi:hypothetical protein